MKHIALALLLAGLSSPPVSQGASVNAVAWSGMPTTPGSSNEQFTGFSNASLNDAATVAFNATVKTVFAGYFAVPLAVKANVPIPTQVAPLPRFTNTWNGIWTLSPEGAGSLVVRSGSYYPFIADMGGFDALGSPVINNSRLCAFTGGYSPGLIYVPPVPAGTPITNFYSVYGGQGVWLSTNVSVPVAFVGESVPGYTNPFTTYVGTLNWLANLNPSNGIQLPTSPVTFTNWPTFASIDRIALPDSGGLIFSATVGATNYYYPVPFNGIMPLYVAIQPLAQRGVWGQDSKGNLTGIVREGDSLTVGGSNRTIVALSTGSPLLPAGCINPVNGEIALNAVFDNGTQGILIGSADSNSLSLAALTGDSAPGGNAGDFFLSFGSPSINSAGHVAFCGTAGFVTPYPILYAALAPSSPAATPQPTNLPPLPLPSYTNSWSGLWAEDASGNIRLIARIAPPVPDIGGFTSLSNPLINAKHQVAFRGNYRRGFIMSPPGAFRGGDGVWTSMNLSNPVAWVGQPAPGYPANFTVSVKSPYGWSTNTISFTSTPPVLSSIERISFPDTGRLVIWGTASATNWVPRPPTPKGKVTTQEIRSSVLNQRGIWIQNSTGALDLALREGMSVSVNGASKVIYSLPAPSSTTPQGGQSSPCSRSNGIVVTTATFTDGTQAILRISP